MAIEQTKKFGDLIKELPVKKYVTVQKILPVGGLEVRKFTNGVISFHWRYTFQGRARREPIGVYDSSSPPKSVEPTAKGYSLIAAIRRAEQLSLKHFTLRESGGMPSLKKELSEQKKQNQREKVYTLQALMEMYCDYLEGLNRTSHKDVRSIVALHIVGKAPTLAETHANEVTGEQIADLMRMLFEEGKGRTANKLRSYVSAAYSVAKAAKSRPNIPVKFKEFGITHNPAADTAPDARANKPDKNPLSVEEMRQYWSIIKDLKGLKGAALRLHLLTGAQRLKQLVRLRTVDCGKDAITIFDGKGRPGHDPRPHCVPLIEPAAQALKECNPRGTYALSTDGGEKHIDAITLSRWACDIVGARIVDFQAKRLRSGVETILAAAKVTQEDRGRLQSHGNSGVQAKHYDGYDYMDEKRQALEILYQMLEGTYKPRKKKLTEEDETQLLELLRKLKQD